MMMLAEDSGYVGAVTSAYDALIKAGVSKIDIQKLFQDVYLTNDWGGGLLGVVCQMMDWDEDHYGLLEDQ